jgi:Tfp pilus assembly protein PilP
MAPKKMPLVKKLLLICVPLALAQMAYIFILQDTSPPMSIKEAISQQVSRNKSIPAERKDVVKVQVALSGYRMKHGKYPKQLSVLVPEYLDTVPLDPSTGAPFKYSVKEDRYHLGDVKKTRPEGKDGTPGDSPVEIGDDEQSRLLAYLDKGDETDNFIYDSSNKRDPFRSFDFSPRTVDAGSGTPLEQYSYNELKLAAVLEGMGEPKAVIEDPKGKGHTVSVGTKIGNLGGVVMKIESEKIVILEKNVEFTGETQTRTVEMFIR